MFDIFSLPFLERLRLYRRGRCQAMNDIHMCLLVSEHPGPHRCAAAECGHHHWKDNK